MQKFPKILKKNWGFYVWTNHLFWYKKASLKKGRHICFNARSINHFNTRAKLTEISWTTLIKSETHNKWIGNVTKATDFWVVLTCPSFVNLASPGGLGQFWSIWNSQGWEIWEDCYWIQEKHMKYLYFQTISSQKLYHSSFIKASILHWGCHDIKL